MGRRILPLANPPYKGFQHLLFPLSAILTRKEYYPWFYNNYIQVFCVSNSYNIFFPDSRMIPWDYHETQKHYIINICHCNLITYIINFINDDYYIETGVDEFYLPHRRAYQKYHFGHQLLINGYDETKKVLIVYGYDEAMKTMQIEISYEDFIQANFGPVANVGYKIYRPSHAEPLKTYIDLILIKEFVEDYLFSKNTFERIRMYSPVPDSSVKFGMDTYQWLINLLESFQSKYLNFDIKPMHLFWENKNCMKMRIEFLLKNNILKGLDKIYEYYSNIEVEALICKNLLLKYSITEKDDCIIKIIGLIKKIQEEEQHALSEFYRVLNNY